MDKEKTEALIKELSKNSSFYHNEQRKAQNRQKHIEALLVKTRHYEANVRGRPDVFRKVQREVADLEAAFEARRDFGRVYVHMDMDMFFAAVEMKKNPQYAALPLGIGGIGMLSTTNYVARQYGVRSGMPGFIGLRLCPDLVIVPTDFPACKVESAKFKAVVRDYDPTAGGLGMDEIMLCLNNYLALHCMAATTHDERFDAAERIIAECRRRVAEATGLTASAGIAPTPTLAKMASNYKKPDGQSSVRLFTREAVMHFLSTVAVRQVPGIGKAQEAILAGLGILTLGDVYAERHRLYCILTRKTYLFLLGSALGVGGMYDTLDGAATEEGGAEENSDDDDAEDGRKSVGQERTFRQLLQRGELQAIAYRNLHRAHGVLVKERLLASQVVLKLKYRTFLVKQHTKTLNVYTDRLEVLQRALDEVLLPVMDHFAEFRLLGVRLEKLKQRADADGDEGATSVPTAAATDEDGGQKTLRDFFTRRQEKQTSVVRKRGREFVTNSTGRDSDVEVLVLSSSSQLIEEDEGQQKEGDLVSASVPVGSQEQRPARADTRFINLDDEASGDDKVEQDDDGDVVFIE